MLGHTAIAHLVAPIWVRRDRAVAAMLARFALAERGSHLTMRWAAEHTSSPARRALYLLHAVDEARHARMFERRARELGHLDDGADADAEDLFHTLGETAFLAFVTLAEGRGKREFEGYKRALAARGDDKTASLFDAILTDERRHQSYSLELLVASSGSVLGARIQMIRVTLWEAWRSVRRASAALGRLLYALVASLLYLLVLPLFAFWVKKKRPLVSGWVDRR